MCVLSTSEYLLVHTTQNRLKIKLVEFTIFKVILTKLCFNRTIVNKPRSFIYLSKTKSMCIASSFIYIQLLRSMNQREKNTLALPR